MHVRSVNTVGGGSSGGGSSGGGSSGGPPDVSGGGHAMDLDIILCLQHYGNYTDSFGFETGMETWARCGGWGVLH